MKRTGLLWVAVVAAVCVGCSNTDRDATGKAADSAAVGTSGTESAVRAADRDFARDVATANLAEIELGRMASEKAVLADVKTFATMMIEDHTSANDKLRSVATSSAIEWPTQLDDKHRSKADDLAKKQGPEFDRDYAKMMVDGHQDFVDKLESRLDRTTVAEWKAQHVDNRSDEKAVVEAKTVEVRPEKSDNAITMKINQWAADTYPVAQKHLAAAKVLDKAVSKRTTN